MSRLTPAFFCGIHSNVAWPRGGKCDDAVQCLAVGRWRLGGTGAQASQFCRESEGQHPRRCGCAKAGISRRHRSGVAAHGAVSPAVNAYVRATLVAIGQPVVVLPICNHRPGSRAVSRRGADAFAERETFASKCGWIIRGPGHRTRSALPTVPPRSASPTADRRCGNGFSSCRNRANCEFWRDSHRKPL